MITRAKQFVVSDDWLDFNGCSEATESVELILDDLDQLKNIQDDFFNEWAHETIDDHKCLTYQHSNQPLFTLRYHVDDDKRIEVYSSGLSFRVGMRFGMLLALYRTAFGFHGVTLICNGKVIILSAPSKTGKSTLARMLHEVYNASIINGDFALLSLDEEKKVVFEPTPFCGTSGICYNKRMKVDHIVFLSQAKENVWEEIGARQSCVHMLSNAFVPRWDEKRRNVVHENVLRAIDAVRISHFAFTPNKEAADVFYQNVTK